MTEKHGPRRADELWALVRRAETRRAQQRQAGEQAFRETTLLRLTNLERDLTELRSRINLLLFGVAGAAITQIVLHFLGK